MRKLKLYISVVATISLCSCRMPREVLWDMVVIPFSGLDKEQVHNIDKFMPICPHAQFDFDAAYDDSLRRNELYYLNTESAKSNTYSLIQTRMYDSTGQIVGGFEICMGNAKFLEIFENVPIASKFDMVNELVNLKVSFHQDVHFLVTSDVEKQRLSDETSNFDYTILVFWPSTSRYYTKRHLRQVRQYVDQFGKKHQFRVIYVHLPSKTG